MHDVPAYQCLSSRCLEMKCSLFILGTIAMYDICSLVPRLSPVHAKLLMTFVPVKKQLILMGTKVINYNVCTWESLGRTLALLQSGSQKTPCTGTAYTGTNTCKYGHPYMYEYPTIMVWQRRGRVTCVVIVCLVLPVHVYHHPYIYFMILGSAIPTLFFYTFTTIY